MPSIHDQTDLTSDRTDLASDQTDPTSDQTRVSMIMIRPVRIPFVLRDGPVRTTGSNTNVGNTG